MYITITHESSNGKLLEAGLFVDTDNFSFEVRDISINDVLYQNVSMENKWRIHDYLIKHVKNIYKLFTEQLNERQEQYY